MHACSMLFARCGRTCKRHEACHAACAIAAPLLDCPASPLPFRHPFAGASLHPACVVALRHEYLCAGLHMPTPAYATTRAQAPQRDVKLHVRMHARERGPLDLIDNGVSKPVSIFRAMDCRDPKAAHTNFRVWGQAVQP
eukprot:353245-Chlamydomonas_euryale.AAC.6